MKDVERILIYYKNFYLEKVGEINESIRCIQNNTGN